MENKLGAIRLCQADEVFRLQDYIKTNWQANHIFVQSKELLLWQHDNATNNNLNYVIALNTNEEIIGVLGFIPTFRFDSQLSSGETSIWLALWKANNEYPGAGFYMLRFIEEEFSPDSIAAIGINDTVSKLYKALGYKLGTWNQYYYLNSNCTDFRIAKSLGTGDMKQTGTQTSMIKEIYNLNELINPPTAIYKPLKSIDYFINRYEKHPIYNYQFLGIYTFDVCVCILVIRKIEIEGSACLRIIDALGELSKIDDLSSEFDRILEKENAEYIDFVNFGINEEVFYKMGLQKVNEDVIIPNYFEPFVKENIFVKSAFKCNDEDYIIFKGDGDQDRPNLLPEGKK